MTLQINRPFTLVLGSGGVKSVAGLGVAEVLQREGLQPAAVAGCSAGAVFGALLAMGCRAPEAIRLATQLWSREITSHRRHRALLELALPGLMRFGDDFALRDDRLIRERLRLAFGESRLEQLATPMHVQATDALSGEGVALRNGSVVDALRASVALPFLFAPQPWGERLLVDGSLSQPVPVAAAEPSHVVLALGFRVPFPQRASSASRLATRVTAALSNNLLDAQLANADPHRLVLMVPALERRVGLFDTEAMPYLLDLGRQAAEAALPRLRLLLGQRPALSVAA